MSTLAPRSLHRCPPSQPWQAGLSNRAHRSTRHRRISLEICADVKGIRVWRSMPWPGLTRESQPIPYCCAVDHSASGCRMVTPWPPVIVEGPGRTAGIARIGISAGHGQRDQLSTSRGVSCPPTRSLESVVMQVAVVTFDGFNELDSFIASALINRCRNDGLEAFITTPTRMVTSMNGVEVAGQRPMEFVTEAEVVLIGSGVKTRDVVADDRLLSLLPLDPSRQLIGAQCSGALVLARLGLLDGMPACTDLKSRPFVEACDITVLDAPFHAERNIATAGGCLASQYLATWVITRMLGEDRARDVMAYVAPVGEQQEAVERAMRAVHTGEIALH